MDLKLTIAETEALEETLKGELHKLLMEIANTDDRKMKEGLRDREGLVRSILGKLGTGMRGAA